MLVRNCPLQQENRTFSSTFCVWLLVFESKLDVDVVELTLVDQSCSRHRPSICSRPFLCFHYIIFLFVQSYTFCLLSLVCFFNVYIIYLCSESLHPRVCIMICLFFYSLVNKLFSETVRLALRCGSHRLQK